MKLKDITQKRLYWAITLHELLINIKWLFIFEKSNEFQKKWVVMPSPKHGQNAFVIQTRHPGIKPKDFRTIPKRNPNVDTIKNSSL